MQRAIRIAVAALGVACSVSSCAHQTEIAIPAGARRGGIGELQIDVREETRLTEGVRGAVIELVATPSEDWRSPLRHVTADTAGRATIKDLVAAHYTVRVWATGHDTVTQAVGIKAGEIDAVRVTLRDIHCTVIVTSHGPVCT
jgi:hypothetical protein